MCGRGVARHLCNSYIPTGCTVITKTNFDQSRDPQVTALEALGWILADGRRAQRFLDLTGLSPAMLRASAASASTHRAVLEYLCAHERDLLEVADALSMNPEAIVSAREGLGR